MKLKSMCTKISINLSVDQNISVHYTCFKQNAKKGSDTNVEVPGLLFQYKLNSMACFHWRYRNCYCKMVMKVLKYLHLFSYFTMFHNKMHMHVYECITFVSETGKVLEHF